jgi:hypothetical protein
MLYFLLIFIINLDRLKKLNALSTLIELKKSNVESRIDSTIALR